MAHREEVWARCHGNPLSTMGRCRPPVLVELMLPSKIKQELTCPICLNVFEDPESLVPCGHTFCHKCVGVVTTHSNLCPVCKARVDHPPVRAWVVRSIIGQQEVHCSNGLSCNTRTQLYEPAKSGNHRTFCKEVMVESERASHEKTCGFKLVGCKWAGCEFVAIRSKVEGHEATCDRKVEKCTMCKRSIHTAQKELHVTNDCPKAIIPCTYQAQGCKASPMRSKLKDHLLKECKYHPEAASGGAQGTTQAGKGTKVMRQAAGAKGDSGGENVEAIPRRRTRSAVQSTSLPTVGVKRKRT